MRGVFGYRGNSRPDQALLRSAATAAARGGSNGCGWAVRDDFEMGVRSTHLLGPLVDHLPAVTALVDMTILGYTTAAGDPQPVCVNGYALVDLAGAFPLARTYAASRDNGLHPFNALGKLADEAKLPRWAVVVMDTNRALYAHRHSDLLWRLTTDQGVYLSSQQFHPAAELLPEDLAVLV